MGKKTWVEVCLISARGLRRSSSLWKLQWYAVGWIHPDNKYCTKIDASGTSNPLWKTGFSTSLEFQPDLALHVEVYSRDPIFLRETLFGSATILLKEFFDSDSPVDEVGSFQLRKNNSNKPLGFVDVSIRLSQDRENPASSYLGVDEGFNLDNLDGGIKDVSLQPSKHDLALPKSQQTYHMPIPPHHPPAPSYQPQPPPPSNMGYLSNFLPPNYSHHPPAASQSRPPPPPPAPSNVGYIPNFSPMTSSYVNMPTVAAARGVGPGFGMGVGAGALAAGAVIFGDDFMSAASRDATDIISTYPPF
ncbi:uncharacterized protein LOC130997236 isoform X1 [Salvia miltiorrhiza]|uniref:uncharacterized protein LOC130997236 isoform X1 n=1 Tax=Salvia miltiorrhiza TaxID=226208 RepID=UPI0025AD643A|nr:uncharacterized protein LOC130997236 isoform X1 [Salvia miltiorrhiza]